MKKQTKTLLVFAGIGAAAYFLMKGKSGAKMIETEEDAGQTEKGKGSESMPEQAEVDHVIDTTRSGAPVSQAIRQAQQLATSLENANVLVKTPEGQPNVSVTSGSARKSFFEKLKAAKERRLKRKKMRVRAKRKPKLSAKFLAQYKKAAKLNCSKYKGKTKLKCISGKRKAALFLSRMQSSVI